MKNPSSKYLFKAVLLLGVMLVGACASTPTPYQIDQGRGGYAVQQLEDNRFRIQFSGNSLTDKATVQNYLLYRCAEVTLDNNHDYFVTVESATDSEATETQTLTFGSGFGHWYWHPFGGISMTTQQSAQRFVAEAQIMIFRGQKPADNLQAFDAWQVIQNLGPKIVRPE